MSWTYVVRPGDTPFSIAQRYLGNGNLWRQIYKGDPYHMSVGLHLSLPGAGPGQRPAAAAAQPPAPARPNATWNQLSVAGQDQITQIVQQFMASIGWPHGFDTQAAANYIADRRLADDPMMAFISLFDLGPGMNDQVRQQFPGARYGMAGIDYASAQQKLANSWRDITGADIPTDVLGQAIGKRWSTADMQSYARQQKDLTDAQPWISEGDTYKNVSAQFQQAYGRQAQDVKTLSAWYRFRQAAAQVGTGQAATTVVASQAPPQQRQPQTEVR